MADKINGGKKPNYLSAREIRASENYNMVGDGNVNNIPKTSILERLEELHQRKKERHKDRISDRKQERHREARHSRDER